MVEEARSARGGELQPGLSASLSRAGLIRYYAAAAAACERASEAGFRFHREEEGSRFVFYTGADPLFGLAGNGRRRSWPLLAPDQPVNRLEAGGPGDAELREPDRWLKRTARLAAEKVYYGYPLVVTSAGELLPVLFAAWPVSGEELQINPALLPADAQRRRLIWRKLMVLRRVVAEGSEPDPRKVQAFRAALASLIGALGLGLGPVESRMTGAAREGSASVTAGGGAEVLAEQGAASAPATGVWPKAGAEAAGEDEAKAVTNAEAAAGAAVYDASILFRGSTPPLPLWLWEDWHCLLGRPAALGEIWDGGQDDKGREQDAVEEPAGTPAEGYPLFLSPFSPAERERLGRVVRNATRRRGWDYLDVPTGDHLEEYLFHLILNGWYAGLQLLVLLPGEAEARQLHRRFVSLFSAPVVAVWGGAEDRRRVFADLQWVLRRCRCRQRAFPPNETLRQTGEEQLRSAWLDVQRAENMVEEAAGAGRGLVALEKELKKVAAGMPPSLLALVERDVRRLCESTAELPDSARPPDGTGLIGTASRGLFSTLSREVEGFLLEAERVVAGRWHWRERFWPWQRRRRALARLELQVRSVLHRAGLNSGDWFAAPLPGDAEGMLGSLRLLQLALHYADLRERYQRLRREAGAGPWDAPESLPRLLAEGWAGLAEAVRVAARERRQFELDSLTDRVIEKLELLLRLEAELAAAAGSPAERELERTWNENFAALLPVLPVWIVPLADAVEPLPPQPALFDLLVVGGAERVPLAAVLALAMRASSVVLVGDARWEAESLGERSYLQTGSANVHQQLAAACGLQGIDYILAGWPVSSLRWLRQQHPGAARAPTEGYLRQRSFPIGTLLNRLYLGRNLLPAGLPFKVKGMPTGIAALRWEVVRGKMYSPAGGSAYNLDEAEAVVRLLSGWLEKLGREAAGGVETAGTSGFDGSRSDRRERRVATIAVVTPFTRQRDLLLRKLAALLPEGYENLADICVLRLDALAGRRFDLVLASLVLSRESPALHQTYLARHPEFVYGLLTAARQSLILVGDPAAIGSLGGIWGDLVTSAGEVSGGERDSSQDRDRARHQGQDSDVEPGEELASICDQAAAAAAETETRTPDQSFDPSLSLIVKGPYPPGRRAIEVAYQELFLMQNGWRGRRQIGSE